MNRKQIEADVEKFESLNRVSTFQSKLVFYIKRFIGIVTLCNTIPLSNVLRKYYIEPASFDFLQAYWGGWELNGVIASIVLLFFILIWAFE